MALRDALRLELPEAESESAFEALVAANQRWLGCYARLHPSFGIEASMLERNSLWMNAFFQKSRIVTPPASAAGELMGLCMGVAHPTRERCTHSPFLTLAADALVKRHRQVVLERLRAATPSHSESEFSTCAVEPMAALMYAASVDRCPETHLVRRVHSYTFLSPPGCAV
jgi:hypothetical protein